MSVSVKTILSSNLPPGFTGSRGDTGFVGSQGDTGFTGSKGDYSNAFTGASAPTSPMHGQFWWDTEVGKLFVYYNDGDSGQWVESTPAQIGYTGSIGFTGSAGPIGYVGSSGNNTTPGSNLGTTSGNVTLDCSVAESFVITTSGDTTFSFTNPLSYDEIVLHITNGGAYTMTFPASVIWSQGIAPSLTSTGSDVLTFITVNSGTTWKGVLSMINVS